MGGRITNAPTLLKLCNCHLHRIPAFCKKSRPLVNKNLELGKPKAALAVEQKYVLFRGTGWAANLADIRTIKSSHLFLLLVLLQKFATVSLLSGPGRYGESWCFFGKNCVESCVLPAGCLMKGTLIPTPNAARFSTIITRANRYIPIVSPMAACIAKMQTSQKNRVFFIQMKTG